LPDEASGRSDEVADPPGFSLQAEAGRMFSLEPSAKPLYAAVQQMVGSGRFWTVRSRTSRDIHDIRVRWEDGRIQNLFADGTCRLVLIGMLL
jgi:hypothetical protein